MMGKVIMSGIVPQLAYEAPVQGLLLSDIAVGSIVKLNENGSPVEFYVAKHEYESGLNGAGRTLLVRKDCHSQRYWHAAARSDAYETSDIDTWLNGAYKNVLDASVQKAISETQFYYSPNGSSDVSTLGRSVFLLSHTELGDDGDNIEGSALEIADVLITAYMDGEIVNQWTRSPVIPEWGSLKSVHYVTSGSAFQSQNSNANVAWGGPICSRPCFTLPATALFDEETLLFKGVS